MRSATDLALRTTIATAQVVLERHLWLMMTEMKKADLFPFLDAPVSSSSLFGTAVEGFAECFTDAQKSSQAMRHFLPKHTSSSSASSRPKSVPTQQTAKPEKIVFSVPHWPAMVPRCLTAVIVDKIKHKHFHKRANFLV